MIHVKIDSLSVKNIIGYEIGTKEAFDLRHGGDPAWVFFDYNVIMNQINTLLFLKSPTLFYINPQGFLKQHSYVPTN